MQKETEKGINAQEEGRGEEEAKARDREKST
jgi:hypothetical protein